MPKAGLLYGGQAQKAGSFGLPLMQTGLQFQMQKQRMEQEKKRLDFEQKLQTQQLQIQQKKLDLLKLQTDMDIATKKAELEGTLQFQQKTRDIIQPTGRRPVMPMTPQQRQAGMPTGIPVPPEQRQMQKARGISMLAAQYGQQVPAAIGQMAKGTSPQKPIQPTILGPGKIAVHPETGEEIARGLPLQQKPNYARYKSVQGGIMDMDTKQWIVEPPKEGEPITFEHITKAMEALDKLGMKDVYWEAPWLGKNKIKKEWLRNFIGGKEVSPELAASIKQKFPDIQLKTIDPKYQRGFEIWQAANPGKTYQDFLNELK